jgi:hypothetical protein
MYAQEWTKQDSAWLQRVLSGEEKLQLNEKTRRAIEAGTLISTDPAGRQMRQSPLEIPIYKSFEGITAPDARRVSPHELPSSVYRLYGLEVKDSIPDATRSTRFYGKTIAELKTLDAQTPRKATVNDNSIRPGASVGFSSEDLLRTIFWPSHRAKKRNAKNANAYKTYNEGY